MGGYPTVDGLAVSPYELGFTYPTQGEIESTRRVEWHHLYYYGRWYEPEADGYGAWRQVFRNLVDNVQPLLIEEHNGASDTLHGRWRHGPRMPKDRQMIDVVEEHLAQNGLILLHSSRRSDTPKVLTPVQWQAKRKRYKSR